MAHVSEIGPDLYRISVFVTEFNLQFNHFLVLDDEPLLFHTGYKASFPEVREAVGSVLDPSRIRWIGFSHFESDECGSLNQWLELAPQAQPVCSDLGAAVSLNDFSIRPPAGWPREKCCSPENVAFAYAGRHTCLTAGTPPCSLRKQPGRCCVRTCSIRSATLSL